MPTAREKLEGWSNMEMAEGLIDKDSHYESHDPEKLAQWDRSDLINECIDCDVVEDDEPEQSDNEVVNDLNTLKEALRVNQRTDWDENDPVGEFAELEKMVNNIINKVEEGN